MTNPPPFTGSEQAFNQLREPAWPGREAQVGKQMTSVRLPA